MSHTRTKTPLATQVLDSLLATGNVGLLMATSLELSLTLAQTTGVHRRVLQEGSTLSGFGLDIVTGMGRDDAGKASQASKESRGADHSGERLYND